MTGKSRRVLGAAAAAALIALLVLALLPRQRAAEGTTIASTSASSAIEERHYITLIVRKPDGVESRTYETNSFVFHDLLMFRFAWPWRFYWEVAGGAETLSILFSMTPLMAFENCLHNMTGGKVPYIRTVAGWYPCYYVYIYGATHVGDPWPPSVVVLGSGVSPDNGCSLGSTLGVYSIPSVSYFYNSVWLNVTVTATFSFSDSVTVSEAALLVTATSCPVVEAPNFIPRYLPVIYDSFPPVDIPAGSELTIVWTIAWKDYGAFTENWGKLWQYLLTQRTEAIGKRSLRPVMTFTDSNGQTCSVTLPPAGYSPYFQLPPDLTGPGPTLLRLAWGTGSSPMSRSTTRLQNETGRVVPSAGMRTGSFAIGGVVTSEAREVGLYWLAYDGTWGFTSPSRTCEILLMRWVPPSPLPPGTPINIFIVRG